EQGQGGGDVVVPPFLVGHLHRPSVLEARQLLAGVLRLVLGLRLPIPGDHRLLPERPERGAEPPSEQGQRQQTCRQQRTLVSSEELAEAIASRRRAGQYRLVVQVALDIGGESAG